MSQAGDAEFQCLETVLIIEELRIGQTSANHTGVAGTNSFAAVLGFNLRNQKEAVHKLLVLVSQGKVFLILLHCQNQALGGNRQEFFIKAGFVDNGPFCQSGNLIDEIIGHDDFGIKFFRSGLKLANHLVLSLFERSDDLAFFFHLFGIFFCLFDGNRLFNVEAVSHRFTAGLQTEQFNGNDFFIEQSNEVLDRADEFDGLAVFELIAHHLRNRQTANGVIQSDLQTVLQRDAGLSTFVYQLILLAVVHDFKLRRFALDAEGLHLLAQSRSSFAFSIQTDFHRYQFLTERFVGCHFGNIRNECGNPARRTVSGYLRVGKSQILLFQAESQFFGKRLG